MGVDFHDISDIPKTPLQEIGCKIRFSLQADIIKSIAGTFDFIPFTPAEKSTLKLPTYMGTPEECAKEQRNLFIVARFALIYNDWFHQLIKEGETLEGFTEKYNGRPLVALTAIFSGTSITAESFIHLIQKEYFVDQLGMDISVLGGGPVDAGLNKSHGDISNVMGEIVL